MTSVEFERMLSVRPAFTGLAGHPQEAPCVRDMIFDYFCRKYPNDGDKANAATREYTDHLYPLCVR